MSTQDSLLQPQHDTGCRAHSFYRDKFGKQECQCGLDALFADKKRLDWVDSIDPVGAVDGWVEAGPLSRQVSMLVEKPIRKAIDSTTEERS